VLLLSYPSPSIAFCPQPKANMLIIVWRRKSRGKSRFYDESTELKFRGGEKRWVRGRGVYYMAM